MTVALWRIGVTTPKYVADDMSGTGAKNTGGRWNPVGIAVTYSSENIALTVLETVVHLRSGGLPLNRYLVRIDVPDDVWNARQTLKPPVGWDALPAGMISVQAGEAWLLSKSSALLVVPSVIVPEEANVLINPLHPDASRIAASALRKWHYDPRHF
ncbi:RES family NAD+ phosphorylase [Noviherbaspirillum pedocola]|uniref:RES family NAD+ phosphorylase n=1 Tax=Noviherbaspirillum pedocola TaxID=2801341 RepID=A0A934W9M5_9BURK|nr:RES family NAD+ phosphorylase [Noviherbaspirillum pedocola]MBK4737289.1 RES family NAD+ phosphorylase [Noviherbaspirillum pedocola]